MSDTPKSKMLEADVVLTDAQKERLTEGFYHLDTMIEGSILYCEQRRGLGLPALGPQKPYAESEGHFLYLSDPLTHAIEVALFDDEKRIASPTVSGLKQRFAEGKALFLQAVSSAKLEIPADFACAVYEAVAGELLSLVEPHMGEEVQRLRQQHAMLTRDTLSAGEKIVLRNSCNSSTLSTMVTAQIAHTAFGTLPPLGRRILNDRSSANPVDPYRDEIARYIRAAVVGKDGRSIPATITRLRVGLTQAREDFLEAHATSLIADSQLKQFLGSVFEGVAAQIEQLIHYQRDLAMLRGSGGVKR